MITIVADGGDGASWQRRYEAGRARDDERSAAWVRNHFGGSVGRTLLKELPLFAALAFVGVVTLGWKAAVVNVVLLLGVVLAFRAWARRRYAVGTTVDPASERGREDS